MSNYSKISQMNIGERIKQQRKNLKLTQKQVADELEITPGAVTQWETGMTEPKNLYKLSQVLKCSQEWLLTGKEKALTQQSNSGITQFDCWEPGDKLKDDEVEIPFFSEVELAAGSGTYAVREIPGKKLRFTKATLRKCGVSHASAVCVHVSGNSMEPVLPDGAVVGIDTSETSVKDGKMYVLDHGGLLRIKVVYRIPGGGLKLHSFNHSEYRDEVYSDVKVQNIRIIGRVFWYSVLL